MAESWKLEVDVVKWEEEYDLWNSDNKLSQSEYYIVTCARAWYISSPSLWGNNNKEDMKIKWKQIGQKLRSKIHFIHIEHTLKNWKNRDFANAVILEFCARTNPSTMPSMIPITEKFVQVFKITELFVQ